MSDRIRHAAIITARDEGEEVRRTVQSLLAGVDRKRVDLHVVLVDDGSTDGSCEFTPGDARVSRVAHASPRGVGRSRNAGWRVARKVSAEAISFHDAHMRFPPSHEATADEPHGLEKLARRALEQGTFVCAGSRGLREDSTPLWGCDLEPDPNEGLRPRWRDVGRAGLCKRHQASDWDAVPRWMPSPCPMGAGYVMSRRTAERLAATTGCLWDDVAGRWGFSEQAMAVKCFLQDVRIEFSRDVVMGHLYRTVNPLPTAGRECRRNAVYCLALLLGTAEFDRRVRPWAVRWLGEAWVGELTASAGRRWRESRRTRPPLRAHPREVWTRLCRQPAPCRAKEPPNA
jgi:glycosyltransferase involved in cell wall biosynthesis